MLTIQTWGGWGDVLRQISLLPLGRGVFRHFRPSVRHLPPDPSRIRPDAGVPSAEEVRDLLGRCPGLVWDGEGSVGLQDKILAKVARGVCELSHAGLYDPGFLWQPGDGGVLEPGRLHIVLQTHLRGLSTKLWPVASWRAVIEGLRSRHPGAVIHVLDPAGSVLSSEGVVVQDRLTFAGAIRLVEQGSLLISVDSWSKYVAGWKDIPQVVLVPDQTPDYPQLTAPAVWRYSFRGLHRSGKLACMGLETRGCRRAEYTFGSMQNLRPEEVLGVVDRMIPGRPLG